MNDEPRRRRRLDEDGEGSGWLSMVALIVVVVLVGLLLGAVLARVFGAKTTVVVAPTGAPALVVTAEPSLTPLPSESASPSSAPTATSKAAATPAATASPAPTPVATTSPRPSPKVIVAPVTIARPHPSPSPTPRATATPSPKPHPKPVALVTARPGPQTAADRAEGVARLYLDALSRGKTAEARSYLASGEPTESSFMDASAHIVSLRSSPNADGSYKVDADLTTSNGEYYVAFTVEVTPGGAVITDHTSIKP